MFLLQHRHLLLYLDTHPQDEEAFKVYRECLALAREGTKKYKALYGPITHRALAGEKRKCLSC